MSEDVEKCWYGDLREKNPLLAPLQCLKCERREGLEFRLDKFKEDDREVSLILLGFEIALFKMFGIKEYEPPTDKQNEYSNGLEVERLCSVDRGLRLSSFVKTYELLTEMKEVASYRKIWELLQYCSFF